MAKAVPATLRILDGQPTILLSIGIPVAVVAVRANGLDGCCCRYPQNSILTKLNTSTTSGSPTSFQVSLEDSVRPTWNRIKANWSISYCCSTESTQSTILHFVTSLTNVSPMSLPSNHRYHRLNIRTSWWSTYFEDSWRTLTSQHIVSLETYVCSNLLKRDHNRNENL